MTNAWDDHTEAIPGTKDDRSFDLDFDFDFAQREQPPMDVHEADTEASVRPSVVVFEPSPVGLADALTRMGFAVRAGKTGVEVMGVVAAKPPRAVLCAPAQDPDRRRLLAAALHLSFPEVPIVYVSMHAGQEDAVAGALSEGARAVLAWPLPPAAEVVAMLEPFLSGHAAAGGERHPSSPRVVARGTTSVARHPELRAPPLRPNETLRDDAEASFEAYPTGVTAEALRQPKRRRPADGGGADEFTSEPITQPNLRPAAVAAAEALAQKRGEIGELLAAVSPFLWSLEDASRWAAELGAQGDPAAANHARALMLLAKILGQLQARIDDLGA